jgi:carboxypeptidase C (cathepsin A)
MKLTISKLPFACLAFMYVATVVVAAPSKGEKATHRTTGKQRVELEDKVSVTQHMTTVGDKELKYTATAGKLVLKDDEGKPKALMFFVAYSKNGVDDLSQRPVSFAFNGGPGSSSVWLHLGMLGPQRMKLPDDTSQLAAPYSLTSNPHTLLDLTDLVFIDPVSTGFSRPAKGEKEGQFYGYMEDLKSVGQFIHDYVTKNDRWRSPKFVIGESYGGVRAAGLTAWLRHRYSMSLNGIIMISPAINYETFDFGSFGNDLPYALSVPGYTAAAWYHKALPDDLQRLSLEEVTKQATAFALNEYSSALAKGQSLDDNERNTVAQKLARFTGLSKEYVLQSKLHISNLRFAKELLRKRSRVIGWMDSRFIGTDTDDVGEMPEYDPSLIATSGPFTSAINDYLHGDLKVEDEHVYETLTDKMRATWSYGAGNNRFPDVSNTLRQSMSFYPNLKLFVASGYYDLSTPPATVKYSLDHLRLPPKSQKNVEHHFYEGGHMMYIYEPAMKKLRKDLKGFYSSALNRSS